MSASAPAANSTRVSSSNTSSAQPLSKPTKKAIRKTAHSLIERRRRSKMNDAFSSLKDMIPACRGGDDEKCKEMHKLDVLNAGIDYLGYLERCLKRMNERAWENMAYELDDEAAKEGGDERALAMGTKRKADSQPHYLDHEKHHHPHHAGEQKRGSQPPLQACHCRCPCHSPNNAQHNTTLPLSPPPSLEPRPQEHTSTHFLAYETRDSDRDREETTNTAAALLMLTSTDRRRGDQTTTTPPTVTSPIPAQHNTVTSPIHHHHHHHHEQQHIVAESNKHSPPLFRHHGREYEYEQAQDQGAQYPDISRSRPLATTIKAGLSVRDLLLSTN